ncbi:hypothetical protein G7Y89_g5920 [Cudoniella acicularis]|uniref:Uncharacterized protein n=1 Tax=Cudoniella acicularis TaxID=354080 RepID=A0A8H4W597_9HELO|nr:hypothetical protein G7Y89_g5920 [Cudoniella acicularis]
MASSNATFLNSTMSNSTLMSNITTLVNSTISNATSTSNLTSIRNGTTIPANPSPSPPPHQPVKLHAPYPPTTAGLGGTPTTTLDDPITAVFLALFAGGAVVHMAIFQINQRRGVKFVISGLLFGFCMARITACTMRLVWSTHLMNVSIAIAAQIFVAAGVILLFITNLIFAQRILRALHPTWAWHKGISVAFKLYYASIVIMLIALIVCTVQSFFTLSTNTRRIDHDVQLVGSTYFAVAAFMPLPLLLICLIAPKKADLEKFGEGRFRTKIFVLVFSSIILTLGAAFRAGTNYKPRPISNPAWYHSKACFYIFNFTIEITVVYLYAILRVDKRFVIPNGSKRAGDYAAGRPRKQTAPGVHDSAISGDTVTASEDDGDGDVEGGRLKRKYNMGKLNLPWGSETPTEKIMPACQFVRIREEIDRRSRTF